MKHAISFILFLMASVAQADCYADYKAKQDSPLRLQYGVARIDGPCTAAQAEAELSPRLETAGWVLLNVMDVFDETGLEQRRDSAGEFYLRF